MAYVPSLYPTDQLQQQAEYNVNEIKKYQFPDCIISYFNYFEMWTPRLSADERKILLNRLLQDDDVAFSIYMANINEPYEVLKAKLIETFTECGESLLNNKKEKRKRKKMLKRMSKDEIANFIRTSYSELNSLSKERLIIKELSRLLPRKWNQKMDLENKCSNVDQMIELITEKVDAIKLKEKNPAKEGERKKKRHYLFRRRHRGSSSSSSSSDSSDDEKKGHHHHGKKHDHGHHKFEKKGIGY